MLKCESLTRVCMIKYLFLGLVELETGLPSSVTEPQIKVPKPKVTKGFISRSARREQELMTTHQVMNSWVLFTLTVIWLWKEVSDTHPVLSVPAIGSEREKGVCGGKEAFAIPAQERKACSTAPNPCGGRTPWGTAHVPAVHHSGPSNRSGFINKTQFVCVCKSSPFIVFSLCGL